MNQKLPAQQVVEAASLIVCDLDGTLVETDPNHAYKVINQVQAKLNLPFVNEEAAEDFWLARANRNQTVGSDFGWAGDLHSWWELFQHFDQPKLRAAASWPLLDAAEALNSWLAQGKQLAILTSAGHEVALAEISLLKLVRQPYLLALGLNGQVPDKPIPTGLLQIISQHGSEPENAIFLGDSPDDALTAQKAGIGFVFFHRDHVKGRKPIPGEMLSMLICQSRFSVWEELIL